MKYFKQVAALLIVLSFTTLSHAVRYSVIEGKVYRPVENGPQRELIFDIGKKASYTHLTGGPNDEFFYFEVARGDDSENLPPEAVMSGQPWASLPLYRRESITYGPDELYAHLHVCDKTGQDLFVSPIAVRYAIHPLYGEFLGNNFIYVNDSGHNGLFQQAWFSTDGKTKLVFDTREITGKASVSADGKSLLVFMSSEKRVDHRLYLNESLIYPFYKAKGADHSVELTEANAVRDQSEHILTLDPTLPRQFILPGPEGWSKDGRYVAVLSYKGMAETYHQYAIVLDLNEAAEGRPVLKPGFRSVEIQTDRSGRLPEGPEWRYDLNDQSQKIVFNEATRCVELGYRVADPDHPGQYKIKAAHSVPFADLIAPTP